MKQAPVEWLMDLNRSALSSVSLILGLAVLLTGISWGIDFGGAGGTAVGISCGIGSLTGICVAALLACRLLPAGITESTVVLAYLAMLPLLFALHPLLSDDPFVRERGRLGNAVFWKAFPGVFGFPPLPTALFIAWTVLLDVATVELVSVLHKDPKSLRIHVTSLTVGALWLGVGVMNSARLFRIFDTQEALAAEKALMESMLTMMCDAIVLLSENGQTVLQSDHRFSQIIGERSVTGESLITYLAEEETDRFQDCLVRAKTAPVLMPSTLITVAGHKIKVELFIVGNRDVKTEGRSGRTAAFLVGLRTACGLDTEVGPSTQILEEACQMWPEPRAQSDEESQSNAVGPEDSQSNAARSVRGESLPETTATGRVFEQVDVERGLKDEPQGQKEALKQNLDSILSLGLKQRWLIPSEDLNIKDGHILGAGSFGVVVSGWLHGSPIAVKTGHKAVDVAGMKHLTAIANEIKILRYIRHPNIVLFHGASVEPEAGEIILVLERVHGPDLFQYVVAHASDAEVCRRLQVLLGVACAVRFLHVLRPQVVHGDLKGSNVLVEPGVPRAKLVDFGLSRMMTKRVKPMGGSFPFMAPEVICRGPADRPKASADVFSLGRVAYMAVACRKPLEGMKRRAVLNMAKQGATPALVFEDSKPLHRQCRALCTRLLSFRPEDRPGADDAHREASSWVLPDMEAAMPSLQLVRAPRGDVARASGGGGETADAIRSFHADLASAVARQSAPPAPAPGSATGPQAVAGMGPAAAAGEATAGPPPAPAAPAGGRAQRRRLALASGRETEFWAKKAMLMDLMMQWNFNVPRGSCCSFHAACVEIQQVCGVAVALSCKPGFKPYATFQCRTCGVLNTQTPLRCEICEDTVNQLAAIQEEGAPEEGSPEEETHRGGGLTSL